MVESVYIESSVISYLVARPSRDVVITARQAITETWWRERRAEFGLYSEEDALHVGLAAAAGIGFLLTWNFKHINNAHTRAAITAIVESRGFVCPMLCSPEELGVEI